MWPIADRTSSRRSGSTRCSTGYDPRPRYLHRVWPVGDGRWAGVVEVAPLSQTPCMTADGQVYERTSSRTVKVTDPVRLRDLFARGEAARERAEALAERAVGGLVREADQPLGVAVVFGLAATSYATGEGTAQPDVGARLFHERFRRRLDEAFEQRLFIETGADHAPDDAHAIRQWFVQRHQGFGEPGHRTPSDIAWVVRASWDGAVGVSAHLSGRMLMTGALFDEVLLPAWRLAADLVDAVGGYGDARAHLRIEVHAIHAKLGEFWRGLGGVTELTRSCEVASPDDALIGSVQREVQRAAGLWSFEGEPDPPAIGG